MLQDEILEQKEKVKQMTKWQRFKYFWYYHWKQVLIGAVALLCICSIAQTIYENRGEYIYVAMVNCNIIDSSQTDLMTNYAKSRQIDESKQGPVKVNVSLSMKQTEMDSLSLANSQSLQALMEGGDYEVLIADSWVIDDFASQAYLCDLEKTLPADLYEKVKDRLYYYEYEEDGRRPIGFYADKIPKISQSYDADTVPIVAINRVADSPQTALDFIQYLLEE